ncbi:helix-turn-helix domain-containing protein [Bacillus paralicheniformis]|uniref:helix-turn-helix domain-containing protein n=1 Tax=Bacillus paralicheniformis TaxID=1648923 RepID=UPI00224406F8|nr:helix-turn-helix transcriptional regulator [Bacillus paralicheniformis]MEC1023548.1 helix-turn-helix transcriptional regulator [Bacillus paralicheniformis]MEC1027416.1 helix-turn-helix transcriptional regulator [Bacillus paralicheniformis]MEC1034380.1 helix-turn-helix transcriptional regulator [Bacillus paralicheniformis]MEC1050238.1 helix-turn-helix transcriptional regulator [Bacillus paralicheniformis]MEC1059825.1 helix-turn-helix transcriptional regulator [Bacillus paralicheniformis]
MVYISKELFVIIRIYKGMTQEQFSKFLGISKQTVSAIERGERPVSKRTHRKVIEKVEITDEFLRFKEKHEKLIEI